MADACASLLGLPDERYRQLVKDLKPCLINIGTGRDITIKELAELVKEIVGFAGKIVFDTGKPDGTPQKLLDVSRMDKLGWEAGISLREGIESTYKWYKERVQGDEGSRIQG
jgi:GDP-L-fucose synthase